MPVDPTLSDDELVAQLERDSSKAEILLASLRATPTPTSKEGETLTWAALGVALAEGAVGWIGGQVFARLFSADKGANIGELIREFIRAVNALIRQALVEHDLQALSADLERIQQDFLSYLQAPRGKDRLQFATDNSSNAVYRLKALGLPAHAGFMVAVGLHIVVLQERFRAIDRGERANIRRLVGSVFIPHAEAMHVAWRTWHAQRYSIRSIFVPKPKSVWILSRDGREVRRGFWGHTRQRDTDANRALEEEREHTWRAEIYPNHVQPSEGIVERWRRLL